MPFLTESEPVRGVPVEVSPGVTRLVARNAGKMTNHGTNTYLLEDDGRFIVLDPGPAADEDQLHIADILRVTEGRISKYVVTHGHHDHVGALAALREVVDAPLCSFHVPLGPDVPTPDIPLHDGERLGPLTAVHTPGHAPDHLCFAWRDAILFSGDHVMGWSTSVVSPPRGCMGDYVDSLKRLADRDDALYLPGHGPALPRPRAYVLELRRRRIAREEEILSALKANALTVKAISKNLYGKVDPILENAAERNVASHLLKLLSEGKVVQSADRWCACE